MGYKKCPVCELNYILDTQELCDICMSARQNSSAKGAITRCILCGDISMPGEELCYACMSEKEQLDKRDMTEVAAYVADSMVYSGNAHVAADPGASAVRDVLSSDDEPDDDDEEEEVDIDGIEDIEDPDVAQDSELEELEKTLSTDLQDDEITADDESEEDADSEQNTDTEEDDDFEFSFSDVDDDEDDEDDEDDDDDNE